MEASRTLILATHNQGKVKELREPLARFGFHVESLPEDFPDIAETGTTFEENALIKARAVAERLHLPAVADDSGLEVDALGGAPGVYSARYCGRHGDDEANNALLLERLDGVPAPRTARYVAAIALVRPGHEPIVRRGTCEGEILTARRGNGGFAYDPLFLCETGETFAEIAPSVKNEISHRRRGIEAVLAALREEQL